MSSSTIFIALQCCQCSTMQVKQKKKSSNKWSCAVCNQKQSVQKVFAQGFMAKDLRRFVQNFNMSRKFVDDGEWLLDGTLDLPSEHRDGEPELPVNQTKKRRTDWTAYLDQEDHHNYIIKGAEQEQDGDDSEPLVVTELHKGMYKKSRSENSSRFSGGGSAKLFKQPVFLNSQGEPMTHQQRAPLTESSSERNSYITLDSRRTQNCKPTTHKAASKWNDYVTEDTDNLELGWKRGINLKDDSVPSSNSFLEAMTNEQRVEDDIHPDFM